MTKQRIFDKVVKHLLRQKQKSIGDNDHGIPICRYRHVDETGITLRCAVGCLIDDGHYRKSIEGASLDSSRSSKKKAYVELRSVLTQLGLWEHKKFLEELQHIHDAYEPEEWGYILRNLAEKHALSVEVFR